MNGLRIVLGALLSHWRRHPLQLASVVAGLWLATALWTGVQALNTQILETATAAALADVNANAAAETARADHARDRFQLDGRYR